jgi:AraC family transcriptional regulator
MGVTEFPDEFLQTPKTAIHGGVLIINVNNNHYQ